MLVKDFKGATNVVISNIVANGPGKLFSSYGGPLKNVLIDNVIADGWAQGGWFINGENIVLSNVHINRKPGSGNEILKNGFSFKDVKGLTLRNVSINNIEEGSAIYCTNVTGLEVDGFKSEGVPLEEPIMALSNVRDVFLHENRGKPGSILAQISGSFSDDIRYFSNDFRGASINISEEIGKGSNKIIQGAVKKITLSEIIDANEKVNIEVEIANSDSRAGLYPVVFSIDCMESGISWVWLQQGETKKVKWTSPKFYKSKKYKIKVGNLPEKELKVRARPPELLVTDVKLSLWDRILKNGQVAHVSAMVKNTGSKSSTFDVVLSSSDKISGKKSIDLEAGEIQTVVFDFVPYESGVHKLDINGQWYGTVKSYDKAHRSDFLNYSFDAISGDTIFDGSGLQNYGLLRANKHGKKPLFELGVVEKAVKFNGESAYVEIPKLMFKYPMTISLWIKAGTLTPSSTAGRQMILYASEPMGNDGYGPEPEVHLMRATGDTYAFWTNASNKRLDLREYIQDQNKWDFLTVIYDEVSQMYINGEMVSEMSEIDAFNIEHFSDRIYIGRPNVDYLRFFNGALDELKFYNEALTAQEVKNLFDSYSK